MGLVYLIATTFGLLILVVVMALLQLDDPGARQRYRTWLLWTEKPRRACFRLPTRAILDAIPTPAWFAALLDTRHLIWSGIPLTEEQYLSAWWVSAWLGLLLGALCAGLTSGSPSGFLLGTLLLLAGIGGPYYFLQRLIRIRRRSVERVLPHFLDSLSLTMEAGLGLVPAIKRAATGCPGILGEELSRTLLQINLGFSQREAFRELIRRIPSGDMEGFVEAVTLSERLGTSLARTMRIQSSLLRTRRRQRAEAQAQSAPIRIIPALVFFFLPSLLLIYLAPPIINFLLRR